MTESSLAALLGPSPLRCLVTGASGYIGGRLRSELLSLQVRRPVWLVTGEAQRPPVRGVEVAAADALEGTGCGALSRVSMWPITSSTRWAQVRRLSSGTATRRHLRRRRRPRGQAHRVSGGIVSVMAALVNVILARGQRWG
jgi:hypothetical protein